MTIDANGYLEYFKNNKPQIDINGAKHWLIEGDILMDYEQLWYYAQKRAERAAAPVAAQGEGLIGIVRANANGKFVRWRSGKVLTYYVKKHLFPDSAKYDMVVAHMLTATRHWQDACSVKFEHLSTLDDNPTPALDAAVFDVAYLETTDKSFYATAFDPDWSTERRHLFVYSTYFTAHMEYDPVGVLRHELGHILGFRHEHQSNSTNVPAICFGEPGEIPDEVLRTGALTEYDSTSVMHYFCGGKGTRELAISEQDKIGAQVLYGIPDDLLDLVA